jgi:hypothetical protein
VVSKREKPLAGGIVCWPPQGSLDVTGIGFNLDAPTPEALSYEALTGTTGGPFFTSKAVQIAPGESVPFSVMGLTKQSYLEVVGGHRPDRRREAVRLHGDDAGR